jgi:glucokinase
MLLAGDIGATKTILAVFTKEKGPTDPLVQEEIVTASYSGVDELVQAFLNKAGLKVSNACFGIAAPVVKGEATMLNMPWVVRESHLRRALNMTEVRLLNDLEAIAAAVPRLVEDDVHILNPGMPEPGAAIAVIAPGTGLGEGFLTWDGRRYHARASEGGHVEFGPANALQIELLRHLGEKFEHVSYERVCCGPGIFNIYDFLRQKSLAEVPEWLSKELAGVPDPTPVIVDAAMDPVKRCRICEMALDIFASILGAEAGNLALKVMATNGVYLAGGIPPRILKILENGKFMQSFRNKGRESFILSQIPVKVIMNTRAGLIGAASYGLENFT